MPLLARASSHLRNLIVSQPRNLKRALQIAFDFTALATIVWVAYCWRFGTVFTPNPVQFGLILLAPVIAIPVFVRMGLYRAVLRYLPDRAVWTIVQAVSLSVLLWVMVAFTLRATGGEGVPRSIPIIYWLCAMLVIVASRFGARWFLFGAELQSARAIKTLVIGTAETGPQSIKALQASHNRQVVGFLTGDSQIWGMDVSGIRVRPIEALDQIVTNTGVEEVIFTSGSFTSGPESRDISRREIVKSLAEEGVRVSVLPDQGELADQKHVVGRLREISVTDLLERDPVKPDPKLMRLAIDGKVILVTGAAGSIGSALAAEIAAHNPKQLLLLDTNEHGVFNVHRHIMRVSDINPEQILGSVQDVDVLQRVFTQYQVDTVYHCAAYKHVAMAEINLLECIRNNVLGTYNVAQAAVANGVKSFVLISTDKAVRPKSVMGATKRWAELVVRYISDTANETDCNFATVRFGNVLGSSGSVVPLFQEQIARGGPVTLNDENMTRYFMSIEEAAELILQAGVLSDSGDTMVLEMGEPVRIRDLAENMIALSGLSVHGKGNRRGDIEIVVTGAKEGEKIHEELFYNRDSVTPTSNPRILRPKQIEGVSNRVPDALAKMRKLLEQNDSVRARHLLFEVVNIDDTPAAIVEPLRLLHSKSR